jgi:hypothetical protein
MEEQEIQTKFPSMYAALSGKGITQTEWKQIYQDLSDLLWLNVEEANEEDIIKGILLISDRIGESLLEKNFYFNTCEINRVRLFIHNSIFNLVSQKDKVKEICNTSKKLINEMNFFKKSKELISNATEENLKEIAALVEESHKRLRTIMVSITLQIEKSIQSEFDKGFSDLLDEIFYNEVLYPSKSKIKNNIETHRLLSEYKNNRYFNTSKTPSSYYSTYPKGENIYIGEVSPLDKKEGYGKMFYMNRDVYEGHWANDKTHGLGLYVWKDGGKYLGNFHQGQMHGQGKRLYSSGSVYIGEFAHNKRSGKGMMKFKNGDTYDGEWHDEDMQGRGMYKWASGDYYVGEFKRDKREGKGTLTLSTGEIYEAVWENGAMKKEETNN